jgi:predicted nucleotidyltransferase
MSMRDARDLPAAVRSALLADPSVTDVQLVGSRARGTPSPLSDWDFVVAGDLDRVMDRIPSLVRPLEPIAQQWDRLGPSDYRCYMLLLAGPTKVDLIFPGVSHRPEPPWVVGPETLEGIDRHFWDWILWLAAKEQGGKHQVVRAELTRMSEHLLEPMGVDHVPASIQEATADYRTARERLESSLRIRVPNRVELEVLPALHPWAGRDST